MIPRFSPAAGVAEIIAFLADVLRNGNASGRACQEFEREFAGYLGCDCAAFVPSGRVGLWLILRALEYPEGAEIVLPGFTFFAIPAVVQLAGLKPVYADVDPATYELTPASVAAVLSARTRAVIPTHLFGRTCDLPGLRDLCAPRGIDLIEDCAQCFGAAAGSAKCGSLGRASYFTFGITKNFTTFGGGMVVSSDKPLHAKVLAQMNNLRPPPQTDLIRQGMTALAMWAATRRAVFSMSLAPLLKRGSRARPDLVHRLFKEAVTPIDPAALARLRRRPTDAQARAGLRQLSGLDAANAARRRRGQALHRMLQEEGCQRPGLPAAPDGDHIYMSYAITRPDRYGFMANLRRMGVDVEPGYMTDCASIEEFGGRAGSCPGSRSVESEIVHLPMYPSLSEADLKRIARAVAKADGGLCGKRL